MKKKNKNKLLYFFFYYTSFEYIFFSMSIRTIACTRIVIPIWKKKKSFPPFGGLYLFFSSI